MFGVPPYELSRLSIEQFNEACRRVDARDAEPAQPRLLRLRGSDDGEGGDDW